MTLEPVEPTVDLSHQSVEDSRGEYRNELACCRKTPLTPNSGSRGVTIAMLAADTSPRTVTGITLRTCLATFAGELDTVLSLVFLILSTMLRQLQASANIFYFPCKPLGLKRLSANLGTTQMPIELAP